MRKKNYTNHFSTKRTPQTQPIPGKNMVQNNEGGFSFELDAWKRLDRFLILGCEGSSYYQGAKELTVENAKNVIECIRENGLKTVSIISAVSQAGRAPKNDPAIFALALCATFGDEQTKIAAYAHIPMVCRIGTHIFMFCEHVQALRKWSRGLRNGVSRFYLQDGGVDRLAYQLIKYRQRNGWTHRDVLRLCHASPLDGQMNDLFKWVVGKPVNMSTIHPLIGAFESLKNETSIPKIIDTIKTHNLPWEAIPTEALADKRVWGAMLPNMPLTAMIRNLGRMTANGLLGTNFDDSVKIVCDKLQNTDALKKARVHPLSVLTASRIYGQGRGMRGGLGWDPVSDIMDALEDTFYASFDNVEPTGKNFYLGIDISASMTWDNIAGSPLTPHEAAAVMAMVTYRTEPSCAAYGFSTSLCDLGITRKDTLKSVFDKTQGLPHGGTDCSAPMRHALRLNLPIDVFVVYTDSETRHGGGGHPTQYLEEYRKKSGRNAKLIVCGMVANKFSIADPNDAGMLDMVGFDSAAPSIITNFVNE